MSARLARQIGESQIFCCFTPLLRFHTIHHMVFVWFSVKNTNFLTLPLIWLMRYRWCAISFMQRCCSRSSDSNSSKYSAFTSCFEWIQGEGPKIIEESNYFDEQAYEHTSNFLCSFDNSSHSADIFSKSILLAFYMVFIHIMEFCDVFFFFFAASVPSLFA